MMTQYKLSELFVGQQFKLMPGNSSTFPRGGDFIVSSFSDGVPPPPNWPSDQCPVYYLGGCQFHGMSKNNDVWVDD